MRRWVGLVAALVFGLAFWVTTGQHLGVPRYSATGMPGEDFQVTYLHTDLFPLQARAGITLLISAFIGILMQLLSISIRRAQAMRSR